MSDYIETLWTQFIIEAEEHLELIEPLLVEAEISSPTKDDVDQLFRSFHSIKGLSKAMDLFGMEAIAHRAEDILGLVRDEVLTVGPDLADALLCAIDALKQHLKVADSTRQDQEPAGELKGRLEDIFNSAKGTVKEVAAKMPADEVMATPVSEVCVQAPSSLHPDPDMVIFFAELLQSNLPKLVDLLAPGFTIESPEAETIVYELEALSHAANAMEIYQLSESLSSILALLADTGLSNDTRRESLINELLRVVELTRFIENEIQKDCGTAPLVDQLRGCTAEMVEQLFRELAGQLQTIASSSEGHSLTDTPEVVSLAVNTAEKACVLNNHLHMLDGGDNSKRLLLTVSEVCNHINKGQAVPETDLIKLLLNAVSVAETEYRLFTENNEVHQSAVDWSSLHQKIWDVIKQQSSNTCSEELVSFKELAGKIEINPIFEDCMSMDNIKMLQQGLDKGEKVYEALVNLEESEAFTVSFLQWIETDVQLVTNSTIFIDNKPWSNCLLMTSQSEDALRESVKTLDPERCFLKLETCANIINKTPDDILVTDTHQSKEASTLRVSGATLDKFMSQIGEIVSIRGMLNHTIHFDGISSALSALKKYSGKLQNTDLNGEYYQTQLDVIENQLARFDQVDQKLHTVLSQLQESALALRVVPMENVFKRFPRAVRDLAQVQGKKVKLEITGQDVRIDKAMVEVLSDPLMHMIRNSVDHGIELPERRRAEGKAERAVVGLDARQQGNTVKVTISDDGCGIDAEIVGAKALERGLVNEEDILRMSQEEIMQFIFAPGFSTAEQITETSGRGVGMDVVRTNVIKLGGIVTVESEIGKGSRFTLELPLSAAIQDTVLVKSSGQLMAIPERYISQMIKIRANDVQPVKGCHAIVLHDSFLPVYRLGPLLGYKSTTNECEDTMVVAVLSDGKQQIGVVIESSYQRQELFIKDIHQQLTELPGVSGASILGDGKVVLILEVEDLFLLASKIGKTALLNVDMKARDIKTNRERVA